jgi:peptidoglycan/LPS O-acetylase OafA/YrhL
MGTLRFLLAISVLFEHSPTDVGILDGFGGWNAVEIFFLISGFYISRILDRTYRSKRNFWFSRALRLYPMYFIICILVLIRSQLIPDISDGLFGFPNFAIGMGIFSNLTLFGTDSLMFLHSDSSGINFGGFNSEGLPLWNMLFIPQAWSLGIEVVFYLLAPYLFKLKTKWLLLIGCISILLRISLILNGFSNDPWSYRFMPTETIFFILGILLYRNRVTMSRLTISNSPLAHGLLISLYVLFPTIASSMSRFIQLAILLSITTNLLLLQKRENRIQLYLGQLSYPIYISHLLVLSSVEIIFNATKEKQSNLTASWQELIIWITLLGTITLSMLLVKITQPIETYRNRLRK